MTQRRRSGSSLVAVAALLLLALGLWLVSAGWDPGSTTAQPEGTRTSATSTPGTVTSTNPAPNPTTNPAPDDGVDPESGLAWVDPRDLPVEARDTLELIEQGGPFPYDQDDQTFGNYEGLLPEHDTGYYREYTVDTPGSEDRGARRIIAGTGGERYWTEDHYQSFERIVR